MIEVDRSPGGARKVDAMTQNVAPNTRTPPQQEAVALKAKSLRIKKIKNGFVVVDKDGVETHYPHLGITPNNTYIEPQTVFEHLLLEFAEEEEHASDNERAA